MRPALDDLSRVGAPPVSGLLLRNNPVFQREFRQFRRTWWAWMVLVVAAWVPLMVATRSQFGTGGLAATWWQQTILLILCTAFRPDVLLGFFLVYRITAAKNWSMMREEIAVTLLTVRQVIVGKAFVPVMILFGLNVLAGGYYYGTLIFDPAYQYYIPTEEEKKNMRRSDMFSSAITMMTEDDINAIFGAGAADSLTTESLQSKLNASAASQNPPATKRQGTVIPVAVPVAVLALLEDLLFAAIVILVALRQYLVRKNAFTATFVGVGWIALIGAGVLGCYFAPLFAYELLPYQLQDRILFSMPLEFLFTNSVWFLCVLPYECLMIWWCMRSLSREVKRWLVPSQDGDSGWSPKSVARL